MEKKYQNAAVDVGLLVLRATVGGLVAGHGAQKLFGSFGGHGIEGTAGWLGSMGMRPPKVWAVLAGASELGSGVLTALGLLGPIGPISMYGPMVMAWSKAHAGKPIWVTSGGAELPLLNISAATALALTGSGRLSLDKALGIKVPGSVVALTAAGVAAGIAAGMIPRPPSQAEAPGGAQSISDEAAAPTAPNAPTLGPATTPAEAASGVGAGIGQNIDPNDELEAREVGSDPPGSFGIDMRGADLNEIDEDNT